ncbi:MAG: signal peptidase II [Bdellovibrionales bacterium]|nr:signal peptidase II [Bdellovibrionales bacterium]
MQKKYIILALTSSLIVALDQATKLYVHSHFQLGETIPVLTNFFNLTYVRNPGAAFGFLRESHETFRSLFFLSMPPLAMLTILGILRGVENTDNVQILALSHIFGGAIGNYIDRLRFGYVIDFLDFHWKEKYSWPAFNVADSTIVIGVCVLLLIMRRPNSEAPNPTGLSG